MSELLEAPVHRSRRGATLAAAAAIALIAIAAAAALWITGSRLFVVETPSMAEAAPVGSLVLTSPRTHYDVGDIVTYTQDDRTVTHRVVETSAGVIHTRGDLNGAADPWDVQPDQIIGAATLIAPGLGFFLKALPWLVLGAVVVEALARIRPHRFPWVWTVRLNGWAVVITALTLWLRPWFNMVLLDFRADDKGAGALMHVVNTGILPILVDATRLVSGQQATVLATHRSASGAYSLTPIPDPELPVRLLLIGLCLLPFIASLMIREPDAIPEGGGRVRPDRRARTILLPLAILTVLAVIALTSLTSTQAAFSASIRNAADTAGSANQNCRFAVTRIAAANPSDAYAAFAMSATSQTSETDISGNGRTGTWRKPPTASTSVGCRHDTPTRSVTFDGSQCLFVPGIGNPQTFSIEAWFSTTTAPNGKIVGFGTDPEPSQENHWDRHIYIDATGRLVFGTFPDDFVVIATPAGVNYADGRWHAVVGTLSRSGMQFYVDGNLVGTDGNTRAQWYDGYWKFGCGKLTFWMDRTSPSNSTPAFFTGQIQYGAIYNRVLTATEVKNHWLSGTW
ncbi:LamG-like jellyroll fold domain-containing protein [uncultured Microbacterium sp.]|uniref:LamG-like jellyroll fold domain-containing protein n=1 Tax=uncultured Microbacterium sp. TaxID=191216 RepID=UPI0025EFE552|nr:LamG-like jellyroll fold domain-containing protein [uncultured Microbacterium sp.]